VVVTIAIGAAILIPNFDQMAKNPPPVTQIRTERPAPEGGGQEQGGGAAAPAEAGTTSISILQGAAVQGSPDYDPDSAQVAVGNKVVWDNQDTVPHTATSGTGPQDPQSGQLFDTSIINPSESATISLAQAKAGQYDFYCMIHPYMTGKITVQ
jgi:plastocyanin